MKKISYMTLLGKEKIQLKMQLLVQDGRLSIFAYPLSFLDLIKSKEIKKALNQRNTKTETTKMNHQQIRLFNEFSADNKQNEMG